MDFWTTVLAVVVGVYGVPLVIGAILLIAGAVVARLPERPAHDNRPRNWRDAGKGDDWSRPARRERSATTLACVRAFLLLIAWIMLLAGPAAAQESDSNDGVFLKCESTKKREKELHNWYVSIEVLAVGGEVVLKQEYDGGSNTSRYRIQKTEPIVYAERIGRPGIKGSERDILTIDRKTGRLEQSWKLSPEEAEDVWNEEKQMRGGFDQPVWLSVTLDCKPTSPVF